MRNPFRLFSENFSEGKELKEVSKQDAYEFDAFDKIVQKKGFVVYRDLKYDEQIKFCLTVKKLLMLSEGWELVADPSDVGNVQLDFVKKNFDSLDQTMSKVLYGFMSAIEYGFSCAELLWKKENGKILLKDLKMKIPWSVEFFYDDFGNFNKLLISSEEVPINKFAIYSYMEQFGDKKGESDLKAAYNAWWFKNNVWKFWARHLERFGSPIVKAHVPPGASQDESNKFFAIINRLHHITGVMLPRAKQGQEEFNFELVESKREGGVQFVNAIENVDSRIARALLLPRLVGATNEAFGSYALGFEQFKMFYRLFIFVLDDFSDSVINRQVIRRMIDYNFNVPAYPKFRMKPMPIEEMSSAVKAVASDIAGNFPSQQK